MTGHEAYLTRSQAALYLGVTVNTVKHWHDRGWLAPDGQGGVVRRNLRARRTPRGWLEYHLADLVAAERDTRRSTNSRRRAPALEEDSAAA
ncbi:hypothetical protein E1091_01520 [Micromonospora fluostatini]|uniref:MerR family transcriptional regulator n=1 Tax=Micromonospora fluostatini TaxID=1629071 RepID=A0ABY2DRG8_9ACTN|nr:hypothetical protein E1091_01520 [Micromonospora fluostatini]